VNFDWLDRRSLDPVGYKRINKRTGREIAKEDVVKGVATAKGEYVVLSAEEIAEAYPRTTQTIEIETFVDIDEVPFVYLEKPYYTAPVNKGEKVYALLREALRETGKAGLARVVIHGKQHLAVVLPCGPALVLNLLRWGGEIRSWEGLSLPAAGKGGIKDAELKMAKHLIEDMVGRWSATEFRDEFHDAVMKLVQAKAKAGKTKTVEPLEEPLPDQGAEVIDLTELLRRSLSGGKERAPVRKRAAASSTPRKATKEHAAAASKPRKRSSAGKTASAGRAKGSGGTRGKRAA
jgi:DNA end-binding protein Ku